MIRKSFLFVALVLISCKSHKNFVNNVSDYINLLFKILKLNTERLIWMIRFHPNNFITTYLQNRKYDKIAKEL